MQNFDNNEKRDNLIENEADKAVIEKKQKLRKIIIIIVVILILIIICITILLCVLLRVAPIPIDEKFY